MYLWFAEMYIGNIYSANYVAMEMLPSVKHVLIVIGSCLLTMSILTGDMLMLCSQFVPQVLFVPQLLFDRNVVLTEWATV